MLISFKRRVLYPDSVESLEFVVAHAIFLLFVGSTLPRIYILNENNFERVSFLTKTENLRINEITSPRISTKPKLHENWLQRIKMTPQYIPTVLIV